MDRSIKILEDNDFSDQELMQIESTLDNVSCWIIGSIVIIK